MTAVLKLMRRFERRRRFWSEVDVRGREECWPWLGSRDAKGRPVHDGRAAGLVAHQLVRGSLPEGEPVRTCDHAWCVNPDHLTFR